MGSDIFLTRLMGRSVICISGAEAARMFWQPGRFTRRAALLPGSLKLLQGGCSSQALDGEDHRHRKAMLMSLQTGDDRARMSEVVYAVPRQDLSVDLSRMPALPASGMLIDVAPPVR